MVVLGSASPSVSEFSSDFALDFGDEAHGIGSRGGCVGGLSSCLFLLRGCCVCV